MFMFYEWETSSNVMQYKTEEQSIILFFLFSLNILACLVQEDRMDNLASCSQCSAYSLSDNTGGDGHIDDRTD